VCRLLADAFGVPRSSVRVTSGATSRRKRVQIEGVGFALATVTAATDPVGALADASPTPGGRRLAVAAGLAGLAALCALVLAGGVVEARRRPRATEPLTAAVAVAMAWAALWLLRPSWSPLTGPDVAPPAAVAVVSAAVALVVAGGGVGWARRHPR
jgi:hypothetical protein